MTMRPIFVPRSGRGALVETVPIDIGWHGGFSISQKQKNIFALHEKATQIGISPVLEISTKSPEELGKRLSAFNLRIEINGTMRPLESVYQSSKVFSESGQQIQLLEFGPFEAKRLVRNLGVGQVVAFRFMGKDYPIEPKNAFYDWLYIRAIAPHEEWLKRNLNFAAYSDIEFTPGKSINCQGRAVAEFHALSLRGAAMDCAYDFGSFHEMISLAQRGDDLELASSSVHRGR